MEILRGCRPLAIVDYLNGSLIDYYLPLECCVVACLMGCCPELEAAPSFPAAGLLAASGESA
jgi:hypothetical protein